MTGTLCHREAVTGSQGHKPPALCEAGFLQCLPYQKGAVSSSLLSPQCPLDGFLDLVPWFRYVAEANLSQRNSAELPNFVIYLSAYLLCVWCVHVCAVIYACVCTFLERLQVNFTCHLWKPFLFLKQSSSQKCMAHVYAGLASQRVPRILLHPSSQCKPTPLCPVSKVGARDWKWLEQQALYQPRYLSGPYFPFLSLRFILTNINHQKNWKTCSEY